MRIIREKINDERIKSINLAKCSGEDLPYSKQEELKKEHSKAYNKFIFFKNLNNAFNEVKKNEKKNR